MIKRLGLAAVILGLAIPAGASAHHVGNHFKWGYNWLGPVHGDSIANSGWAGWDWIDIHKTSGGLIRYGFMQPDYNPCFRTMSGNDVDFWTRLESGCDPYVFVYTQWISGNDSYLRFDTYS